jgi:hypothetical protein
LIDEKKRKEKKRKEKKMQLGCSWHASKTERVALLTIARLIGKKNKTK